MRLNGKNVMKAYISTNPKVMGGQPVIVGTRIPLKRFLFLLQKGYSLEDVQKEYPWLPLKKLEGVLKELADILESQHYGQKTPQTPAV